MNMMYKSEEATTASIGKLCTLCFFPSIAKKALVSSTYPHTQVPPMFSTLYASTSHPLQLMTRSTQNCSCKEHTDLPKNLSKKRGISYLRKHGCETKSINPPHCIACIIVNALMVMSRMHSAITEFVMPVNEEAGGIGMHSTVGEISAKLSRKFRRAPAPFI